VARRATAIEEERKLTPRVLLLDAGNALTGQSLADATRGKVIIEAMNRLGYTAMTIGEVELQLGLEELTARMQEAKFPMLSANVMVKSTGKPLAQPYTVVELGRLKVGILGLTNDNAAQIAAASGVGGATPASVADQFTVTDPLQAARRFLPELAAQSDIVVLLSHMGLDMDQRLAQEVAGIAVIVGGSTRRVLDSPLVVQETLIVQAGYDGEWLGRLRLKIDGKKVVRNEGQVLALGPEYKDHPDIARWLQELKSKAP